MTFTQKHGVLLQTEIIIYPSLTADDMGLGKTLTMLSLVVVTRAAPGNREWLRDPPPKQGLYIGDSKSP